MATLIPESVLNNVDTPTNAFVPGGDFVLKVSYGEVALHVRLAGDTGDFLPLSDATSRRLSPVGFTAPCITQITPFDDTCAYKIVPINGNKATAEAWELT